MVRNDAEISGVVCKHSHAEYAGIQSYHQQEWDFVQCIAPDVGKSFGRVEESLCGDFPLMLLEL